MASQIDHRTSVEGRVGPGGVSDLIVVFERRLQQ